MQIKLRWPFTIKRNLENPPKWLIDWADGGGSESGVKVNENTALAFAAVWSSVKLLSESVAGLPIFPYERTPNGKEVNRDHPIYNLIHNEPNAYQTKHTFIQALMYQVLLYGNGYALIQKDRYERPKSLHLIHPDMVDVVLKEKMWYKVEGRDNLVPARNMIHILGLTDDGITGIAPIRKHRDSIGLGMAAEKFGNTFFKNGANSTGVYEVPTSLDDEQFKRLKAT